MKHEHEGNWLCHEKPQEHVQKIMQHHCSRAFAPAETAWPDLQHCNLKKFYIYITSLPLLLWVFDQNLCFDKKNLILKEKKNFLLILYLSFLWDIVRKQKYPIFDKSNCDVQSKEQTSNHVFFYLRGGKLKKLSIKMGSFSFCYNFFIKK